LRLAPIIFGAASAVLCLPLLAPAAALAAAHGEDTPLNLPADQGAKHVTGVSGGGSLVRTVVGLAIVLAVIYGVAWVLKQVKSSIGIVESVDPDGSIHTIEGNSSNAVSRRTYGPDGGGAAGYVRLG
jgi:hypothetical protein